MANRAYLYSYESFDSDPWNRPVKFYFDSRWNIPLAWFFFFSQSSVHLIDRAYEDSTWQDLELWSQKDQAITTFTKRLPLLEAVLHDHFDKKIIDDLLATVSGWSGNYLMLHASEIFDGMGDDLQLHIEKYTSIFRLLEATDFSALDDLFFYSGNSFDTDQDRQLTITGFTYW